MVPDLGTCSVAALVTPQIFSHAGILQRGVVRDTPAPAPDVEVSEAGRQGGSFAGGAV